MAFSQTLYDKENTRRISLKLNKTTDSDILAFLDSTNNKQGLIKDLLRRYISETKVYTLDEIRCIVADVATQEDLQQVILFGSYARGEATGESDLDFCVTFPPNASMLNKNRVMRLLKERFGKEVDVVSKSSLKSSTFSNFVESVQKEGVVIYDQS